MNFFKKLTRTQKISAIAGIVVVSGISLFDNQDDEYDTYDEYYSEAKAYQEDNQQAFAATGEMPANSPVSYGGEEGKVVLYDKGLQMPISTIVLPEGWKVNQDIAFDPNNARPVRYQLDVTGPNGELSRGFATMSNFGYPSGKSFEQAYQEALRTMIGNELTQVSIGNLRISREGEALPQFQKMAQKLGQRGMKLSALEVEITGQRNGQPYKGLLGFAKTTQATAMGEAGMLLGNAMLLAPVAHYDQLLATAKQITESTIPNPAREQRLEQINQRAIQQIQIDGQRRSASAAAAHQQRMANNQAAFNAHQQNIQSMSQAQDASFNSYMNGLRNSGSYNSSGSNYGSHNAYIDQIHERSTFNDPYSGQEMNLDGQYDYNYTNGLGDYHRTNDPSFDPNSMQGDWQQIEPQYPY